MSHHFKCAVVKKRSSTGEFLHAGFKPIVINIEYTRREYFYKLEAAIHELYPQVNGRTKLIVIDKAGDEMAWTWEDLSSDYEFINWLKSYFNENDDIKLFIQPDYVVYPPTSSSVDEVTKNLIESTIRNCVTEQLHKIEHTGIINSFKLMNIESSLCTQTAVTEQLVKSQEEAAGETQQSLTEMKKEVEDVKQFIEAKMTNDPVVAVQPIRMFIPEVEKNDAFYVEACTEKGHSSTHVEYYDADSSNEFVMNSRAYYD